MSTFLTTALGLIRLSFAALLTSGQGKHGLAGGGGGGGGGGLETGALAGVVMKFPANPARTGGELRPAAFQKRRTSVQTATVHSEFDLRGGSVDFSGSRRAASPRIVVAGSNGTLSRNFWIANGTRRARSTLVLWGEWRILGVSEILYYLNCDSSFWGVCEDCESVTIESLVDLEFRCW